MSFFGPRFYNFLFKQLNTLLLYHLRLLNLQRCNGLLPSKSTDRVKRNALLIISVPSFPPSGIWHGEVAGLVTSEEIEILTIVCYLTSKQARSEEIMKSIGSSYLYREAILCIDKFSRNIMICYERAVSL